MVTTTVVTAGSGDELVSDVVVVIEGSRGLGKPIRGGSALPPLPAFAGRVWLVGCVCVGCAVDADVSGDGGFVVIMMLNTGLLELAAVRVLDSSQVGAGVNVEIIAVVEVLSSAPAIMAFWARTRLIARSMFGLRVGVIAHILRDPGSLTAGGNVL